MEKAEDLRTETERATRIQEQMDRMEKESTEMKGKVEMSKGYGGRGDMRLKGQFLPHKDMTPDKFGTKPGHWKGWRKQVIAYC